MSKRKDPLYEALQEGVDFTWTIPEGGDLASMRAAVGHGQTLTMSPVTDPAEIEVGDMVLVTWHNSRIIHLVGEIQANQYLIVNSLGKVNGWVKAESIHVRVSKIVDPEPRPELPDMLSQLGTAYKTLIHEDEPTEDDARRLLSVVDDLHWYAGRIGVDRWDIMPRSNVWSLAQNLWRLSRLTMGALDFSTLPPFHFHIDRGKECVGKAVEILNLFESTD